ncbi:N-acyl amino acid synthase FeeM domain-containing protein [Nitrosospira lacus]|nr:hypothetical protein [Nitrosospira lacus]
MQLQRHSDKIFPIDRTYSPPSAGTGEYHSTPRLQLTSRTMPVGKLEDKIPDQKYVLKRGNYNIRLADSLERRSEASALIKRMYSWRGYNTESTSVSSSHNQTTLEALSGQELVGTLALRLDSDEGLLADKLYEPEINPFRARNRKLCELSKLAIDPHFSSKELLASLFNLAYIYGRVIHQATDFIIEINPRHAGYYKRMLGFHQISEMRTCPRVNAPAVLLRLELDYVDAQVSRLAGVHKPAERSLYSLFLTKHEEKKIANRIWHINEATTFGWNALCG